MKLTSAQIEEIAGFVCIQKSILKDPIFTFEEIQKRLTEKFGEPNEAEEWPRFNDEYFVINHDGNVVSWVFVPTDERCIAHKETGNIYRTKEKAEAVVVLRKHVQKFEEPKNGDVCYILTKNMEWVGTESGYAPYGEDFRDRIGFSAGYIMPLSSTEEDRAERIRLLKACYEN